MRATCLLPIALSLWATAPASAADWIEYKSAEDRFTVNFPGEPEVTEINPEGTRTFAGIYLHESRLYIAEATVPPYAPVPGLFQQSLGFVDENGDRVRYDAIYSNRLPPIR